MRRAIPALLFALGCVSPPEGPPDPPGGNVLVVVMDDVGIDKVGAYRAGDDAPPTPTLDGLAGEGVVFRNAFAYPSCSPSRAAMLTGRYGRRTGVGRTVIEGQALRALPPEELGIGEVLGYSTALTYTSAAVGKWHLATGDGPRDLRHPHALGFDAFSVVAGNPGAKELSDGSAGEGYFRWEKNVDGRLETVEAYMTTDQVDDAIAHAEAMPEPWFLWLAFNAAHTPVHVPPPHLHTDAGLEASSSPHRKFKAMVEAMDAELGRFLATLPDEVRERTTVVVVGDNGTPSHATVAPFDPHRAKTTLFEAGVHVPLIVAGPHVARPGTESAALVHVVDLLPTVAEIAGAPYEALYARGDAPGHLTDEVLDGTSLLPMLQDPDAPGRDVVFTEKFAPNGDGPYAHGAVAVRGARWRLMVDEEGRERLYDLAPAGFLDDGPDLLAAPALSAEARAARDRLRRRLADILDDLTDG